MFSVLAHGRGLEGKAHTQSDLTLTEKRKREEKRRAKKKKGKGRRKVQKGRGKSENRKNKKRKSRAQCDDSAIEYLMGEICDGLQYVHMLYGRVESLTYLKQQDSHC